MKQRVSVVVPSRLQVNLASPDLNLYLDLCLGGIMRQTADVELEMIVGLDQGQLANVPGRFLEKGPIPLLFVESDGTGQAKAVNAAAAKATGDVLAFCEDDDLWDPRKLDYQLPALAHADLVTCSQRERTAQGAFVRVNDFPTPSGWVMRRRLWEAVPKTGCSAVGFDETFRFHVDTEWLGRARNIGERSRFHLIPDDGRPPTDWLRNVARFSRIGKTDGFTEALVHRTVNPEGGMSRIATDPEARAQSQREHEIMLSRFGSVPW
jgi:glycosyltransferase involved in cell wall biosynthesis